MRHTGSGIDTRAQARQLLVLRRAAPEGTFQTSRIEGMGTTELYVCVRPHPGVSFERHVEQVYELLDGILCEQGARRGDVVSERIFFYDMSAEAEVLHRARRAFYQTDEHRDVGGARSDSHHPGPATTYLQQPPCRPGVLVELQAHVIFPSDLDNHVEVRVIGSDLGGGAARKVSYRGDDHLYAHNITGGEIGDGLDYSAQMESIFERARALLEEQGLSFSDVIRTWIYLPHMARDYHDLNRVRTAFFERVGVERLPASTGIQAGVYPADRLGSMDFYALRGDQTLEVRPMQAGTLNEAWSYGSSFSRGMAVTCRDRTVLYLSGTASIDEQGRVVDAGDVEGQVERMLTNVEELLAASQAMPSDLLLATTYLKRPEYLEIFDSVWRQRGFPGAIPNSVVQADVCRPEWLCEMEVMAIFPARK